MTSRALPGTAPPPTPEPALLEHALTLIARQQGGDPATADAATRESASWRRHDPRHEAAWQAADQLWNRTNPAGWGVRVALPPTASQRRRRLGTRLAGVAALVGLGGLAMYLQWQQPLTQTPLATQGERMLEHRLADGSLLSLDVHSAARILDFRDRRVVMLDRGSAHFDVRPDRKRPFMVQTPQGRVEVLGTAFEVRLGERRMDVAVGQGTVNVCSQPGNERTRADACPGPQATRIQAGQQLAIQAGSTGQVESLRPQDVGAWRQGWLVFDDTPLPQVVRRWNGYLPQPLRLAPGSQLHSLRLTGSFPLDAPETFLQTLPQVLPVQVARDAQGVVIEAAR